MTAAARRSPGHEIDPLFHERWSPRAFSDAEIPVATLRGLFEAARWAPSAMNAQPWRFVWARRGTPAFDRLLATLAPANQAWARRAAALVALASAETLTVAGQGAVPSASHAFDAGAAWAQLALQAHLWGWGTHAIGGFDRAAAAEAIGLPAAHRLEVVIAIGKRGDPGTLPEWAKARERPNDRKAVEEIAFEGTFGVAQEQEQER
ncbi:MAG: nitroreductase family protein [Anaeromyxobacteraceae bacterium]